MPKLHNSVMGKQNLRKFILEYLSPKGYENRLRKSNDIYASKAPKIGQAIRNKFGKKGAGYYMGDIGQRPDRETDAENQIQNLVAKRKERVAAVEKGRNPGGMVLQKPTKLSRRGFDDSSQGRMRNAPQRKPSYDIGHRIAPSGPTNRKYGTLRKIGDLLSGRLKDPTSGY